MPELVVEMHVWTAGSALVQWGFFSVTVEGCELSMMCVLIDIFQTAIMSYFETLLLG